MAASPCVAASRSMACPNGSPGEVGNDTHILVNKKKCSLIVHTKKNTPVCYSTVNISSIVTLNTFAIFHANTKEGLYLPFSRLPIVSRRTPTNLAKSSCFMSYLARYSFILFFIMFKPPAFFKSVVPDGNPMYGNSHTPPRSKAIHKGNIGGVLIYKEADQCNNGGCYHSTIKGS